MYRENDPVEVVKEKALFVYNYLRRQAAEALALAKEKGVLQDRDVQIAAGVGLGLLLLVNFSAGIFFAAGYLAYHYIRCDDRAPVADE